MSLYFVAFFRRDLGNLSKKWCPLVLLNCSFCLLALPKPIYLCFVHPFCRLYWSSPFLPPTAGWTCRQWLGCGALGRNCPVNMQSSSGTCRMSSTRPGTWPSTATFWAARACSRPSSHCSQWLRRTSLFFMKVEDHKLACLIRSFLRKLKIVP